MVDNDTELNELLENAVDQAAAEVTERDMNPVDSLTSLYDRIDQAMGCFCFIFDQPL